jgi:peroxiredoxin
MKRFGFLFILVAILMAGCRPSGIRPGTARISGTIQPVIKGYLNVTAGPVLDSARIGKDGSFSIDIPLKEPMKAMLFFNNRLTDVYLEPGKSIDLKINSTAFPNLTGYEGELGPVNHYLTLARKLDQQTMMTPAELFSREPEDFMRVTDSIRDLKLKLLEEYRTKYPEIDSGFVARAKADIGFAWADQRVLYPSSYQIFKGTIPVVGTEYYPELTEAVDLNANSNLQSSVYREFIQDYLDYRAQAYLQKHGEIKKLIFPESVARFRVIHEEFANPQIIDYLLYSAMKDHLASYGTIKVESFLTDFRLTCKNQDYVAQVNRMVEDMEKVALGEPAPDFTAYRPDGKKVKISDYFGQLLYIGFWASWSDWSLQEIPYFEQLRKDFQGKPVKFILLSMDFQKDKNRWKAIIDRNGFGSIQLIQDPESKVLGEKYFLQDIPRYFLIGKDGMIISAFAPRPTENITETLKRILAEEH